MTYEVIVIARGGTSQSLQVEIEAANGTQPTIRVDGEQLALDAQFTGGNLLSLITASGSFAARLDQIAGESKVVIEGEEFTVEVRDPRSLRARRLKGASQQGPKKLVAAMPGKIVRALVSEGETVEVGQGVIVIEAMKMQNEMKAPKAGVVRRLAVAEGDTVSAGDTLAIIE